MGYLYDEEILVSVVNIHNKIKINIFNLKLITNYFSHSFYFKKISFNIQSDNGVIAIFFMSNIEHEPIKLM